MLVVDNDPDAGARDVRRPASADRSSTCTSPAPGIAAARNRALDESAGLGPARLHRRRRAPVPAVARAAAGPLRASTGRSRSSARSSRSTARPLEPVGRGRPVLRPAPAAHGHRRSRWPRPTTCCSTWPRCVRSACGSTSASGSRGGSDTAVHPAGGGPGRAHGVVRRGRRHGRRPRVAADPPVGAHPAVPCGQHVDPDRRSMWRPAGAPVCSRRASSPSSAPDAWSLAACAGCVGTVTRSLVPPGSGSAHGRAGHRCARRPRRAPLHRVQPQLAWTRRERTGTSWSSRS